MQISSDGLYQLFCDCANDATTGATVAVWHPITRQPHPEYPNATDFLAQYGDEIPPYVPLDEY